MTNDGLVWSIHASILLFVLSINCNTVFQW
jgi:hypothetical protein